MNTTDIIAVSSRSFSQHPLLRAELLKRYQQVRFNDAGEKLVGDKLVAFLQGATKAIIGLEIIDENLLKQVPTLKVICKKGTGLDKIDQQALVRHGVALANAHGLNQRSVSELVVGLAIASLRRFKVIEKNIEQGKWKQPTGEQLTGKTVGIVGFGAVGQDVAKMLQAFQCRCLAYDIANNTSNSALAELVSLPDLLTCSDIVTLHVPLNQKTRHLIGANELALMKRQAILINTARGGLVNEKALAQCLRNNTLAGAAFDVLENESELVSPLLQCDNAYVTSHIGGSTEQAILAMGMRAIEALQTATVPPIKV